MQLVEKAPADVIQFGQHAFHILDVATDMAFAEFGGECMQAGVQFDQFPEFPLLLEFRGVLVGNPVVEWAVMVDQRQGRALAT